MIVRKYPKIALFGHFSEIVGSIAFNGTEEVFETKKVKVLIKPSDKTKGGYVFYNSHPIAEEVLEQNDPLRKQYPTLSRLLSVYYDEDFYDETSKEPQNPLSVMAEFCFEEPAEIVQNLLEEITNYLQTKPTPEEADAFLTSLGNEFYYQASEISAIEWLEYLSVRLDQWVFHGDEPISSKE